MQLEPVALESRWVRLEPMAEAHKADFRAACEADAGIWTELYPYSMYGEHFEPGWQRLYANPGADRINFAVVADGRCVGVSSWLRIDPANAMVEIGGTYYRPEYRGGATNPAAKGLLLGAAFDNGARRVAFQVDASNARSRAAVLKLGATQEGILRQDRVTWTGRIRDTVVFSILADEWPAIRERLDGRLQSLD